MQYEAIESREDEARPTISKQSIASFVASLFVHKVIFVLLALFTLDADIRTVVSLNAPIDDREIDVFEFKGLDQSDVDLDEALEMETRDSPLDSVDVNDIASVQPDFRDQRGAATGVYGLYGLDHPAGGTVGTGSAAVNGELNERLESAGARTGEVQVSLMWNNVNDIDLHVITPKRERIWYQKTKSSCGGELDIDMNVRPETEQPVENVYWPTGSSPHGEFIVFVHHYRNHNVKDPTNFVIRVQVDGMSRVYEGSVKYGDPAVAVCSFRRAEGRKPDIRKGDQIVSHGDPDFDASSYAEALPETELTGMREWTNSDGELLFEAVLVAVEKGWGKFKREDGEITEYRIRELDRDDRNAVSNAIRAERSRRARLGG